MIIHSYEKGERQRACISRLKTSECLGCVGKIILLPIPSTRDNATILNTNICIDAVLEEVDPDTLVSGYGLPRNFCDAVRGKGGMLCDFACDERFLYDNADLTALCTLGILLNTQPRAPRDLCVGIIGYGRIGKRLCAMLLYLGARLRIFTSRENTRIDLCEYGVATAPSTCDADLSGIDVLVNTAPAAIFDGERIPPDLRVIDLASGENFPGVRAEKYPSVPAKMLPVSAGRIWGEAIERYVVNNP